MELATPPSPSSKVRLQDSPLSAPSAAPAAPRCDDSETPTSRWQRTIDDSEDDGQDDEIVLAVRPTGSRGHRSRPSTSRLLDQESQTDEMAFSPDTLRRQRRLRSYADDEGLGVGVYVPAGARRFGLAARAVVRKNEGLLLIVASQVGFAIINTCVKLLEEDVAVPVYELIVIRMLITFAGCYAYLRWWARDPHPFLGPPGVRLLLCLRGFVGFFGLYTNYAALQYLSLADASTLWFVSPVLVGIQGWLILGEPYTRLEALVGIASLSGTIFIAKPSFLFPSSAVATALTATAESSPDQRMKGVSIILFGVIASSSVSIIIRFIGTRASALHSISYFSLYSVLVSSLYPLVFDSPPVFRLTTRFFVLLCPIGVLGFLSQALMTMGLIKEKAGRGALATYTNLLFTMIMERLVFGKLPDIWSLIGAAIIVGGAVRVALEHKAHTAPSGSAVDGVDEVAIAAATGPALERYDPLAMAEEGTGRREKTAPA
ncbi:RHTO0S14e00254g1_1 [Rhodotorula toruloides]|uniref:RHTO0S14e00254g1_1 n=1 Tax=Rhodotorula toruloides TaxID=5286 RepID=A0A061BJJ0_RHOTO|nr:RHTO0S14e00254g1_1 [Rhodotorula toruloides]